MPTPLPDISALAWEHPADRAALANLRGIPGFSGVVKQIANAYGERGIRNLFLGNAVRVGPTQRPRLWAAYQDALRTLDWPARAADGSRPAPPELYVTRTPWMHAGAVGFAEPFIVLNAESVELLDDDRRRFALGHELGHVMSGRLTYRTIAALVMTLGINNLPLLLGVVLLPFQLALLDWYRKAELSGDRAGLLALQDPRAAYGYFLRQAGGGGADGDTLDLDAFLAQAAECDTESTGWSTVMKALNTALRDHPLHTLRVAELRRWAEDEAYTRILVGDYVRRGTAGGSRPEPAEPAQAAGAAPDPGEPATSAADARATADPIDEVAAGVRDVLGRARAAFDDAFRSPRR
jgi:Zn-dependent protease with chaperone function